MQIKRKKIKTNLNTNQIKKYFPKLITALCC